MSYSILYTYLMYLTLGIYINSVSTSFRGKKWTIWRNICFENIVFIIVSFAYKFMKELHEQPFNYIDIIHTYISNITMNIYSVSTYSG